MLDVRTRVGATAALGLVRLLVPSVRVATFLVDGEECGEGAYAVLVGPGVDLVAHREAGDGGPDLGDLAGEVVAQDNRQTVGHERLEVPVADPEVQRVDSSCVDLDQDIVRTHLGAGTSAARIPASSPYLSTRKGTHVSVADL